MTTPLILGLMGAALVLTQGQRVKKEDKAFACPICAQIDPYRDESACAQCEKHHEWMHKEQQNGDALVETVKELGADREEAKSLVREQVTLIDLQQLELQSAKVAYAAWGAFTASMVWTLILM